MDSKVSQNKHDKYLDFYNTLKSNDNEYWGLGIENESYIMFKNLTPVTKEFIMNNHKRERYSVDYWINYRQDILKETLKGIPNLLIPRYINAYQFQKCDILGEHKTLYTKEPKTNPNFNGKTINDLLQENSPIIKELFNTNMIYDGDTFEFTTFNFYKTNVRSVVQELIYIKQLFIDEINNKNIFKEEVMFPEYNYGFVKFQTNSNNLGICNNGTYHINITLPTDLDSSGNIKNLNDFKKVHANAIRAIQWIEPLLCALYGSPDILHVLNSDYSGGSQRLGFSRYIGLGTYDTTEMEKGKLLDTYDYQSKKSYFNELSHDSPYILPERIGYDFNYNKFKKHGIELRIFDYFSERLLESVINLLLLVCDYSTRVEIPVPNTLWKSVAIDAIKKGSSMIMRPEEYSAIYNVFQIHSCFPYFFNKSPLSVLNHISDSLYYKYKDSEICKKMSPRMIRPTLVNYNMEVKDKFRELLQCN